MFSTFCTSRSIKPIFTRTSLDHERCWADLQCLCTHLNFKVCLIFICKQFHGSRGRHAPLCRKSPFIRRLCRTRHSGGDESDRVFAEPSSSSCGSPSVHSQSRFRRALPRHPPWDVEKRKMKMLRHVMRRKAINVRESATDDHHFIHLGTRSCLLLSHCLQSFSLPSGRLLNYSAPAALTKARKKSSLHRRSGNQWDHKLFQFIHVKIFCRNALIENEFLYRIAKVIDSRVACAFFLEADLRREIA